MFEVTKRIFCDGNTLRTVTREGDEIRSQEFADVEACEAAYWTAFREADANPDLRVEHTANWAMEILERPGGVNAAKF